MEYQCLYGSSVTSTATQAVLIASVALTCEAPTVTPADWTIARGYNRELMVDFLIKAGSAVFSLPQAIYLFGKTLLYIQII